jgi:hypothetical protein
MQKNKHKLHDCRIQFMHTTLRISNKYGSVTTLKQWPNQTTTA